MKYCKLISACAVVAASIGFAAPAMAAEIFNLDTWQGSGSQNGPFGTVTLTQNGSNVDVLVSLAGSLHPEGFVNTGAGDALDFYLASGTPATAISPITITGLTTGFSALNASSNPIPGTYITSASTYNAGNAKGFNYAISCDTACGSGGSGLYTGSLSFTVDNVTLADFLQSPGDSHGHNGGFYFAADICDGAAQPVTGGPFTCSGNPGVTGPVSAEGFNDPVPTPEPITLSLFGAGLAGAVAMRRRKKA